MWQSVELRRVCGEIREPEIRRIRHVLEAHPRVVLAVSTKILELANV
jgi:hypothetical protein